MISENGMNLFNLLVARAFKLAVCNTVPCVVGCGFHFDAKLAGNMPGKTQGVGVKV
jgi:hypothetical protein